MKRKSAAKYERESHYGILRNTPDFLGTAWTPKHCSRVNLQQPKSEQESCQSGNLLARRASAQREMSCGGSRICRFVQEQVRKQ
jgi:hypothetical protein